MEGKFEMHLSSLDNLGNRVTLVRRTQSSQIGKIQSVLKKLWSTHGVGTRLDNVTSCVSK